MTFTESLYGSIIFGAIGMGYFVYGKKQRKGIPLACGVGLFVFPFVVTNLIAFILVGVALVAIPYFVRI